MESSTPSPGAVEIEPRASIPFRRIFIGVMIAMFISSIDQTIVATALPTIAHSFNSLANISWVAISYMLFSTIAVPIYGRLSDIKGRRWSLIIALSVMAASTLMCTVASSLGMLILARSIQGFGGGGINTLSVSIIAEVVAPRQRGKYQVYFAGIYLLSNSLGPFTGGVLSQLFGWRSVFGVQLPIIAVAIALALYLPRMAPGKSNRMNFDFVGAALFSGGVGLLLLALTQLGEGRHADLPVAALIFGIGAALTLLFVRFERRVPSPLIPPAVISQPSVWRSSVGTCCFGAVYVGGINFLPLYLQVVKGYSSGLAGTLLAPLSVTAVLISTVVGWTISRTGWVAIFPTLGFPFAGIAMLIMAFTTTTPAYFPFDLGILIFYGIGCGAVMSPLTMIVQSAVKLESIGSATSAVNFGRAVGGAIGVAIATSVMLGFISIIDPAASSMLVDLIEKGPALLDALDPAQRILFKQHLGAAFTVAFCTLAVFPLAGAIISLTIPIRRI